MSFLGWRFGGTPEGKILAVCLWMQCGTLASELRRLVATARGRRLILVSSRWRRLTRWWAPQGKPPRPGCRRSRKTRSRAPTRDSSLCRWSLHSWQKDLKTGGQTHTFSPEGHSHPKQPFSTCHCLIIGLAPVICWVTWVVYVPVGLVQTWPLCNWELTGRH